MQTIYFLPDTENYGYMDMGKNDRSLKEGGTRKKKSGIQKL